ncbi:hypothetical protein ACSBR1_001225 [Camellia fascicularis]
MMLVLVQLVVVVIFSLSAATIAAPTEQELKNLGCTNRSGNLDISYPFSVEVNCYLNDNFFINCSDSQPYLWDTNIHVTNTSLEEASMDRSPFPHSPYRIARTSSLHIQITDKNGSLVATGCRSQCSSINSVPNDGSCSGIGCCQLFIAAKSFSKHENITDFNPCSYAFVVEDGAFNFSTTYLHDFKPEMVPIVLDWGHLGIIRVLAPNRHTVMAKQMEHVALLIQFLCFKL